MSRQGRAFGTEVVGTVDLQGVTKRFARTAALGGVSVTVTPGITGLLGPNGAGKTTLMRILATVLPPDSGTVRVLGYDPVVPKERQEIRRRLGYLPQDPSFFRSFTVFQFLEYVAVLKELTDRRARHHGISHALAQVQLKDAAGRRIRALSGGMRRRVALAAALIGEPALLILDEPTVGLDPEQRLRFRELISRLGEQRTVLLSTHQTEDVSALCARVIVMHRGSVRFAGTPSELAEVAQGKVWVTDRAEAGALLSWRMGDGRYRSIGQAPKGAELAEPTIEDGYLLLVGSEAWKETA